MDTLEDLPQNQREDIADILENLKEDSVVCQADTRTIRGMKIVF